MLPHSSKSENPTMNAPTEQERMIFDNDLGAFMPRFIPIGNNYVLSIEAEQGGNLKEAYRYQNCYLNDVVEFLRREPGQTWNFSLMNTACKDLRCIAEKADEVSQAEELYTEEVAKSLKALYEICLEGDGTNSGGIKKQGMLIPINHILRIYFKLEKYKIGNELIKSVEPEIPKIIDFQPQLIMFKFHKGRFALLARHYNVALESLRCAYDICSPNDDTNKRMVLAYLLPTEIIMDKIKFLTKTIADQFNLTIIWDLYKAIQANDLRKFHEICEENETFFSNEGLLVILDELKDVVYLNILKVVYGDQTSYCLPIASYQVGLNAVAPKPFDDSEMLDLLTSLKLKKKIEALLASSHDQGYIVFSPENPFPLLC